MTCLIISITLLLVTTTFCDTQTLYELSNPYFSMYMCTDHTRNNIGLSQTASGASNCPITKFNIIPNNGGLVLMFKLNTACSYLCLDSCGNKYITDKYVAEECTWSTVAYKDFDTLSQNRGNYTQFLAFIRYDTIPLYASKNFNLHTHHQNIKLKIKQTSSTSNDICKLNVKNVGINATCTNYNIENYDIDLHKNYAAINLFDKLLAFLGFYSIVKQETENTLRMIDYTANYNK
ncbi:FGF-1 [Mocis latipes granulovirus]|uniref:FGF-1 n=1 Tax=Mocis latipes granulovirus TaxID=2072024 RepID=A0A162GWT2_9BBAC|nr:FGF-1 [Mocis latipes granulovirus]AKR17509.1 FGF-1 [Mocis latipes granulovirus]